MSVIVSDCIQICNSPVNNSTAKQLYSFSKSKRFEETKRSPCAQTCYDLPNVKSHRAAGFGYGDKYDFTNNLKTSPAPNAYNVRDSLSHDEKKKGFSFGLSREIMASTGALFLANKHTPGPGTYEVREKNKVNISYSFRPKTILDIGMKSKVIPGPGNYKMVESITKDGKYFISKFKSSGATRIDPAKQDRFKNLDMIKRKELPGPGTYERREACINSKGSYFVSKFRSSLASTFGSSIRKSASTTSLSVPGPGSYRTPSDFGYYESAKYAKSTMGSIGTRFTTAPLGFFGKEQKPMKSNNKESV